MVGTALGFFMFFCADGILTTMGNASIVCSSCVSVYLMR